MSKDKIYFIESFLIWFHWFPVFCLCRCAIFFYLSKRTKKYRKSIRISNLLGLILEKNRKLAITRYSPNKWLNKSPETEWKIRNTCACGSVQHVAIQRHMVVIIRNIWRFMTSLRDYLALIVPTLQLDPGILRRGSNIDFSPSDICSS